MPFSARQVLTAAQLNDLSIDTLTTSGNVEVGGTLTVDGNVLISSQNPQLDLRETLTTGVPRIWLGQLGTDTEGLEVYYNSATGNSHIRNVFSTGILYHEAPRSGEIAINSNRDLTSNNPVVRFKGNQVIWGSQAQNGFSDPGQVIGTTATIANFTARTMPSISAGATWTTFRSTNLNGVLYTTPYTAYRWGINPGPTAYCLYGITCYTNAVSRKRARIRFQYADGTSSALSEVYFFFNQTGVHHQWVFWSAGTLNLSKGLVTIQLQLYSDSGSVITDSNDNCFVWVFLR